jgi:reductive dehalogenase
MGPGYLIICILGGILLLLFLPLKGARAFSYKAPKNRIHEADAVLSRRLLKPGTQAYEQYYKENPHLKKPDDQSRQAPGLLSENARYHHPGTFAAAIANFHLIDFMGKLTHTHPWQSRNYFQPGAGEHGSSAKKLPDADKTASFIINWMKQSGSHSSGITLLQPHHLYSHKGRGARSGQPIHQDHSHAIAITVEMDHRMMMSAPEGSSVMESSEQYLRSGMLALKLASFIRELGYEATAHIDGNYEVICPLVAVDAGLGTIGRMGLLMTPQLGPRVRIAVVTTNLALTPSSGVPDRTTIHFCHLCKKCAENCPVSAIPDGPRSDLDGVARWQINSEKCYHFWTISGTDCGRCISVCPFSHRNNWFHGFIRWAIKNNLLFRYLAIKLDDIFYGRRPSIRPLPEWAEIMDKP